MQPIDPRDARIAELEALVGRLTKQLEVALARVAALEAEVATLKRNSTNSSKPPSSDPPNVQRPTKQPTGKKRGGQPGHKSYKRSLLPAEKVDVVVPLLPSACGNCGAALQGCDVNPLRHQVVELPPITPHVTEYQRHALCCRRCKTTTRAPLPHGVPQGSFGPRISALIATCTAKYRMSKRSVREFLADVLGLELALGSVTNVEKLVSASLIEPVEEARNYVRTCHTNADETGWRENKCKAWLWVFATSLVSVFVIAKSRGGDVAKAALGEDFQAMLTTDRWSAYHWVDVIRRQLCWSHLTRDFQSWVDAGGAGAEIGAALLAQRKRMFKWWHRTRDGTISRPAFRKKMRRVRRAVGALLREAEQCEQRRVAGMAKQILKLEPALWRFVDVEGIEPTNNFGERTIRHAVIWRKGCYGTDSEPGSRFVERMLTAIATLRQQDRNVLEFLTEACTAKLNASPAPSLLPSIRQFALTTA